MNLKSIITTLSISVCAAFVLPQALVAQTTKTTPATESKAEASHLDLSRNECLKNLNDNDPVIASIAFKDGVNGFQQLKELVSRKPWGALPADSKKEIDNQVKTQSPFLIIRLNKKQTLALENHRDIILWVLVQSTNKTCE